MEYVEVWKDIKGTGGMYRISNFGNVWSCYIGKCLSLQLNALGYYQVNIVYLSGNTKKERIHRLVALHFLGEPPENKTVVNHINSIKTDNRVENIEWCSVQENNEHSFSTGTRNLGSIGKKVEVNQYDLEGNYIATYPSIRKAAEEVGIDESTIRKVLTGKIKTAAGYKWERVEAGEEPASSL